MTDDDYTDKQYPYCPYCGREVDEWWDQRNLSELSDGAELSCPSCPRDFTVYVHVRFSSYKEDEIDD